MKVLSIGSDPKLFEEGSAVRDRQIEYGELVDELHVISYTRSGHVPIQLADNVFVYPTNSRTKFSFFKDAHSIGKAILSKKTSSTSLILDPNAWLITAQEAFTALPGLRLRKDYGISVELQVHTDIMNPYFRKRSLRDYIRYRVTKNILPKVDTVRVVSERIAQSLSVKSEVLPIWVDVDQIKRTEAKFDLHERYPSFETIILMASRFEKGKNIQLAIEAFAYTVRKHSKVGLVIVGSGPEEKKLKRFVERNKLSAYVDFVPWTNDMVSYYKTADIFLTSSDFEGYGVTLIEAAAANLPIITTDVGLVGEVLNEEHAMIVPPRDLHGLVGALDRMVGTRGMQDMYRTRVGAALIRYPSRLSHINSLKRLWRGAIKY